MWICDNGNELKVVQVDCSNTGCRQFPYGSAVHARTNYFRWEVLPTLADRSGSL